MRHACFLLLLASCGGIAYEDYAGELTDATCEYFVRCSAVANLADCREAYDRYTPKPVSIDAALDAGKVRYDEDAAQECIDAYHALSCDRTQQTDGALDACDSVFSGTLELGDACGFDRECKSNTCTDRACDMACCLGTCVAEITYPGPGEPCTSLCDETAYCGADAICHALLPPGAACDNNSPCVLTHFCDGGSTGGSGVCKPLPHEGEPCDGICAEEGALCIAGVCTPAGLAGDPCTDDSQCAHFYTCVGGTTCGAFPSIGMPCTGECDGEAYCDGGVCAALKPDGATCMFIKECASHFCRDDNVCGDPPLCI